MAQGCVSLCGHVCEWGGIGPGTCEIDKLLTFKARIMLSPAASPLEMDRCFQTHLATPLGSLWVSELLVWAFIVGRGALSLLALGSAPGFRGLVHPEGWSLERPWLSHQRCWNHNCLCRLHSCFIK